MQIATTTSDSNKKIEEENNLDERLQNLIS